MPYIETLTHIFEVVASVFLQHQQLALFVGGAAAAAATLGALQDAAAQQQLAVLDAFVEDFKIAKRAHTLRSKQVPPPCRRRPPPRAAHAASRAARSTQGKSMR